MRRLGLNSTGEFRLIAVRPGDYTSTVVFRNVNIFNFLNRQYSSISLNFSQGCGRNGRHAKGVEPGVLPTLSATPAGHRLLLGQLLLTSPGTPDPRNDAVPRD